MDTNNNDTRPCDSCLRWPECNGVDYPDCPLCQKEAPIPQLLVADVAEAFTRLADVARQIGEIVAQVIARLMNMAGDIARWGLENRPRLMHLALHGKTARVRKKNMRRVTQEYMREVVRCV